MYFFILFPRAIWYFFILIFLPYFFQLRKKKSRVKTIEYWIDVARECVNLGNFNSLMGIITGLNMTPVARLKRTVIKVILIISQPNLYYPIKINLLKRIIFILLQWLKIQSGKFAVLEHQMDPSCNFISYRSTLKAAVSRSEGTTDQRQRVVIPFFSLLVKDLYFLNQGCANRIEGSGHINYAKMAQLADQLKEFAKWKDVECPYEKCSKAAEFLQKSVYLSEDALDYESYECESPELSSEKERYKILKYRIIYLFLLF